MYVPEQDDEQEDEQEEEQEDEQEDAYLHQCSSKTLK